PSIPQYVLFGNIYDVYPLEVEGRYVPYDLKNFLSNMLKLYENVKVVLSYEPLFGFRLLSGSEEDAKSIGISNLKELSLVNTIKSVSEAVNNKEKTCAFIFDFSSRLQSVCQREVEEFFYHAFRLCFSAIQVGNPAKYNPIFFLFERDSDLPPWYYLNNPLVRLISIPKPDVEIRKYLAQTLLGRLSGWEDLSEEEKKSTLDGFVDQTSGMYGREVVSIVRLAIYNSIPAREINEAVRRYKIGVSENPWAKLSREKLEKAEEYLRKRVIGQEKAVLKSASILRRAYYNLSGAQFSRYSQRPKGVLFLAGPTGVGKTELAKAISELIFGSESSYIRFDMSEFSHEHTDQRLIGSPPGYVGYEQGGELVNAIKQNPFSVVLFDEIEKAHPKILDIFLQILDDGRITSGKGETVYFSEAIIIFTSNLGIYEVLPDGTKRMRVTPDDPYEKVEEEVLQAIHDYFKYKLARPEILNRIGENIVVFDFIRKDTAVGILNKMLNNVKAKLWEEHRLTLELEESAFNTIKEACLKDLSMGGRGIGNKLEEVLVTPLSNLLFRLSPKEGSKVLVKSLRHDGLSFSLEGVVA
ncbi:MAG: AAA family ATPase, partial [Aquificaceae bacterium]|nr:AAA family ATPase [Aquificaceae bacterium]